MSMQRVLETARKLGLPVVVTDPAGREPFVLLPLEQFEAMAGESKVFVETGESLKVSALGGKSQKSKVDDIPLNGAENSGSEIPIEDRFYLEPVE